MTSPNTAHLSIEEGIATLEFDNPPHNRLSRDMLGAFEDAIAQVKRDDSVRVLVLTARGNVFSHGGDISVWPGVPPAEMRRRIVGSIQRANSLETLSIPTVAVVQGDCYGGGFEYALRCDVIIAADDAYFCHTEQSLGVFTLLGGVQRVAERAGRARAMKWALTSERVSAAESLAAGVITEVVPLADLAARARDWASRLASGPTLAHAAHKRLLQTYVDHGVAAADALMPELAESIFGSMDAVQGIASGLDALQRNVERPVLSFQGK